MRELIMMNKLYFPIHLDGDNRGCEAIAKGTIEVLNLNKEQYVGLTTDLNLDSYLGINEISTLVEKKKVNIFVKGITYLTRAIKNSNDFTGSYRNHYDSFLKIIGENNICMITGGDMFCYCDNELNYIIAQMTKRKISTVLWGCSFGPENLTPAKMKALKQITAITARESLTYAYFVNELKIKKVKLVSDPAFTLVPQECELPDYFDKDVLGINLSNFTSENYSDDNVFFKAFMGFIEYIISNTDLTIVLIPHVFWKGQDDRIVCKLIKEKASKSDRIRTLNTKKMNYCQIRYAISKCRYFIGARTHAMISAYSTCTPSIALGYSIKSRGIAKDLGLDGRLVIDYHNVKRSEELIECFEYMVRNEERIRSHLQSVMPEYVKKAYSAKDVIEKLQKRIEEKRK